MGTQTTSTESTSNATVPHWSKQFWPWFLILLPTSVVVASIVTMVIAFDNPHTLVKADYYKNGLTINRNLESEAQAKALKIGAQLTIEDNYLNIRLTHSSHYTAPEKMSLNLIHPVNAQQDYLITLNQTEAGIYKSELSLIDAAGEQIDLSEQRWYFHLQPISSDLNKDKPNPSHWLLKGEGAFNQSSISLGHL